MLIVNLKTGDLHVIAKYVKSQSDGEESVWCNDWAGRHVIGKDCAFIKSHQLNTTQPPKKNELVIPDVSGSLPCDHDWKYVSPRYDSCSKCKQINRVPERQ